MRYARITPEGELFEFATSAKYLPTDTDGLSLGIRKGLIDPDLLFKTGEDESEEDAFARLRADLLDRLAQYQGKNVELVKSYVHENVLRHNVNWPRTEDIQ